MKILLTGATGYIGKKLLPLLIAMGHKVVCCVRDKNRLIVPASFNDMVETIETDFLDETTLSKIPDDIEGAYYLLHSMSSSKDYQTLELQSAKNFIEAVKDSRLKHVIYLSGIVNDESLSKHLSSRKAVEDQLAKGNFNLTTLRAGIIIGSGSASFQIISDLVKKLPVMIAPRWLNTRCQPIGIKDVTMFLAKTLGNDKTYNKNFDIGGPDVLTYKEMLIGFARSRGLRRWIFTVPVMTPRLSSYWLYFITSTSYMLAVSLVNSMKVEVICRNDDIASLLNIVPVSYEDALNETLETHQK